MKHFIIGLCITIEEDWRIVFKVYDDSTAIIPVSVQHLLRGYYSLDLVAVGKRVWSGI